MHLFSVKSLYKWSVQGEKHFNLEERIVLFWAKDFKSAVAKAEKEAKSHVKYSHTNCDGKKVTLESLEFFDGCIVDGDIKDGVEVFSSTALVTGKMSNKQILTKVLDLDQKISPKQREHLEHSFMAKHDHDHDHDHH